MLSGNSTTCRAAAALRFYVGKTLHLKDFRVPYRRARHFALTRKTFGSRRTRRRVQLSLLPREIFHPLRPGDDGKARGIFIRTNNCFILKTYNPAREEGGAAGRAAFHEQQIG